MDPAPTIPREMTTHRPNLRVATPLEGLVSKPAVEDLPRTWQARTLKEEAQPIVLRPVLTNRAACTAIYVTVSSHAPTAAR